MHGHVRRDLLASILHSKPYTLKAQTCALNVCAHHVHLHSAVRSRHIDGLVHGHVRRDILRVAGEGLAGHLGGPAAMQFLEVAGELTVVAPWLGEAPAEPSLPAAKTAVKSCDIDT